MDGSPASNSAAAPAGRYICTMFRPRVTLRDVARRARVHTSTASRVLNPATRELITERIARRVTTAAEQLGYQPNPNAYSLKTNRTRTVGVLIPDIANPVFPPILRGIEDAFAESGYTAILANTDNDRDRGFTAVVAANDMIALGCYDAAREIELRIPDDFSVTGFNDMPFLDKLHPALTTVRIPHYQMGAQAARTLLARLNGGLAAVEHVTLLPELIARGSTAPPPGAKRTKSRRAHCTEHSS